MSLRHKYNAQWIPCEANLKAELLSRFVDKDKST